MENLPTDASQYLLAFSNARKNFVVTIMHLLRDIVGTVRTAAGHTLGDIIASGVLHKFIAIESGSEIIHEMSSRLIDLMGDTKLSVMIS
jgi:hypothetical protein